MGESFTTGTSALGARRFAILECELIDRESYSNRTEARLSLFDYIEGWYNPRRIHSSLDYRSPMNYEEEYYLRERAQPEEHHSEEQHSLAAA
jgi:putative transposase